MLLMTMSEKPVRAVRLSIGRLGAGRHSMSTGTSAAPRVLGASTRSDACSRSPTRYQSPTAASCGIPAENVSQDGHIQAEPVRPVCSLEAPELTSLDSKRRMVQKIESAIAAAYAGIANTDEVLILINHYPPENVGWQQSLQSDKPEIVAAIAQING
jgi:hypothetical protein